MHDRLGGAGCLDQCSRLLRAFRADEVGYRRDAK